MAYKHQNRVCNEVCNGFLGQIGNWIGIRTVNRVNLSNAYGVNNQVSYMPGSSPGGPTNNLNTNSRVGIFLSVTLSNACGGLFTILSPG